MLLPSRLILVGVLVFSSTLGAQRASVFDALRGDWIGEGTLMTRPARFTMTWRHEDGFAFLQFSNGFPDTVGNVTPVLRAVALYRTGAAKPEGVWLDSRGVRIELAWEASDTMLVVTWTAPTETGRTTYRMPSPGQVHVSDEVRRGTEWRTFGTAVYRRGRAGT
jgi:hypothetical protein